MKFFNFVLIVASFACLCGCQDTRSGPSARYSGEKDKDGNFLVLDTKTGNVSMLNNEQLIKIPNENEVSQIKEYPSKKIPGMPIEIVGLRLKFRDGTLLYEGHIKPVMPEGVKQTDGNYEATRSALFERLEALWVANSSYSPRQILFKLIDADDFNIIGFNITRNQMIKTVDESTKPVMLSFEGEMPITPSKFKLITNYDFSWNLVNWEDTAPKQKAAEVGRQ